MLNFYEWWSFRFVTAFIIYKLLFYIRNSLRNGIFQRSSLPSVKGNPVWNYLSTVISIYKQSTPEFPVLSLVLQIFWAHCLLYGKQGLWQWNHKCKPVVVFFKQEALETLMSDPELIEKSSEYNILVPWLGKGLITSGGTKWRKQRKLLTPAFHFSILENCIKVFQEQSDILVSKLQLRVQEHWIDVLPLLSACTIDIICQTAMGISINAQMDENCEYFKALNEIEDICADRILKPWFHPDFIFNLTTHSKVLKKNLKIIHDVSEQVIKEKKIEIMKNSDSKVEPENEQNTCAYQKRKPFLEILLEYHLKDSSFTERDIRDEVDTFMFAGNDTTSTTMKWVLYCLGLYPEIQNKVHEELMDTFGKEENIEISLETLPKLKYLECVIKETLRLYPAVPAVSRETKKRFKVLGHEVYPGTICFIFILGLHRDPETFPNPEVFDPDRFLPENSKGRHPYAYVPFSAGPRNCIGQKFAMMEMKTILSIFLRRFRVTSLDSREKIIIHPNLVTQTVKPLRMRFESR